ncbi:hypothetical protein RFF05_01805 [Bengtsoniella intestinalis]|uniref:phage tail assembly chaperone n=1 Tax=Bengtsoniella intestinalis TaxID=3073143 RepID=UPI00391F44BD
MSHLMEFLLGRSTDCNVVTEVALQGFPQPFKIKSISEAEHRRLRETCQRSYLDPKTHQKVTETDVDLLNNRMIVACCVDPNFKDADIQSRFGMKGGEFLVETLLKPFEYLDLLLAVQAVNGCGDINEVRNAAKN